MRKVSNSEVYRLAAIAIRGAVSVIMTRTLKRVKANLGTSHVKKRADDSVDRQQLGRRRENVHALVS
jgi:hypothetical protein